MGFWFKSHDEESERQHTAIILGVVFGISLLGVTVADHSAVIFNLRSELAFQELETWITTIGAMLLGIFGLKAFEKSTKKEDKTT